MMSGPQISDTLFSFELLVEYIQVDKDDKVYDELALGVRLLDFPTLLIYQPQRSSGSINQSEQNDNSRGGVYAFNRGKSCFFKMNLNSLYIHLSNTPLYTMLLDVKEETPRLVGSSLISLAKAMDTINRDVTECGVSTPSSHTERALVALCNLAGEKIGVISLSYKLLCLGASLLPHITEGMGSRHTSVPRGQQEQQHVKEKDKSKESLPVGNDPVDVCSPTLDTSDVNIHNNGTTTTKVFINDDTQHDYDVAEHRNKSENLFEEDLSVFCPPQLYYSNSAEERSHTGGEYKLLHLDSEGFTFEDSSAEDEMDKKEVGDPVSPVMHQKVRVSAEMSHNQETSSVAPHVLREALQQLPLLNALLVELSQLSGQNPHQSLTVHPNLAWIYGPASSEVSAAHRKTPQTKSPQKTRSRISPRLHTPRSCSTPLIRAPAAKATDKKEETVTERKSAKSHKTKLVYGTTKTFTLRLKQICPLKAKHHEYKELLQRDTQPGTVKEKAKSCSMFKKSTKRKSASNQSHDLNENIETVIQSVTVDSALHETVTLKQENQHRKLCGKQDTHVQRIPGQPSFSERDVRFIHIPSVNSDSVPRGKDENEHHRESDQSQPESDRDRGGTETSGSSRHSSRKSSFSVSSREGNEEVDYADDFNSLDSSDDGSPDPVSSPELSRAKTPKSPVQLDSDSESEGVQKRAALLPVPVKASSSPQRALRGTHIIRPRTHTSALSFSSDDGDRDGSSQTLRFRTQGKASSTHSSRSSPGKRSESVKNSSPVGRHSAESISSIEPLEADEMDDELGSLDFRKEYQHISQLVASKLPGYTM